MVDHRDVVEYVVTTLVVPDELVMILVIPPYSTYSGCLTISSFHASAGEKGVFGCRRTSVYVTTYVLLRTGHTRSSRLVFVMNMVMGKIAV